MIKNFPILQQNIKYSRLKNIFARDINYKNYQNIVKNTKQKTIGNLPTDILHISITTPNKSKTIKKIQKGFAQTAKILSGIHKEKSKNINQLKAPQDKVKKIIPHLINYDYSYLTALVEQIKKEFLKNTTEQNLLTQSSNTLKKAMEDVLPADAKIKISNIGEGFFAICYKVEFLNNKKEKLFNDCVLKIYKNNKDNIKTNAYINNAINKVINSLSDNEISQCYTKATNDTFKTDFEKTEFAKYFKKQNKSLTIKELKDFIKTEIQKTPLQNSIHGVNAEANSYTYITKALGHNIEKTNLNKHYYFDLQNKFNISSFAGPNSPKTTKRINYTIPNIQMFDIYENYANIVYGKIIDVGGTQKTGEVLDKTVLKYYKKIMNRNNKTEQQTVLTNLKELVKNHKTPHRKKIQEAINRAEAILKKYKSFNQKY